MSQYRDYKHQGLKIFANPLLIRESSVSSQHSAEPQNEPWLRNHEVEAQENYEPVEGVDYRAVPEFKKRTETTNIELFYDLFFVANLTAFSSQHEINDTKTLSSYIGFFCILWFTWCQVSLFDVRFVADSVLERTGKAVHLGVMVGMAIISPQFVPDDIFDNKSAFQSMSLILMVSRIVLAIQYLLVGWHVRKYHNAKLPFILIAAANLVAAAIYLGLKFGFNHHDGSYIGFYVVAIFEIATNIVISSNWKSVTFKGTHLVQRLSLLTLIILGEGVMTLVERITKIVNTDNVWDSATIGTLVSAISIVYLLYMLYFDALPEYHFGSIRQQIWAGLHFPFHLALVLFLEGTGQWVLWFKMNETVSEVLGIVNSVLNDPSANTTNVVPQINDFLQGLFEAFPPEEGVNATVTSLFTELQDGFNTDNQTSINSTLLDISVNIIKYVYGIYDLESAGDDATAGDTGIDELQGDFSVMTIIFLYFFIAAGVTLILMGVLNILTLPHSCFTRKALKHPGVWFRMGAFFIIGAPLAALAAIVNSDAAGNLIFTPWLLPVVVFCLLIVLVVQYIKLPERMRKRGDEKD
ncbi:hypothetical protein N431DRAFT_542699 [Stipitochalara longipes BDJ]|nr:hypothetical protein N431DRAFT_542699 [Stipitochalara longipes BDJ]